MKNMDKKDCGSMCGGSCVSGGCGMKMGCGGCGMGACGGCQGGRHHMLKMLLKLLIVALIFAFGFKLGVITGEIRGAFGRGMMGRGDYGWGMMRGYDYYTQPAPAAPATPGATTPAPVR